MRWTSPEFGLIVAGLTLAAALPAMAEESWQPITIEAFLNGAGAPTWLRNCAGKDGGRIAVGTQDLGKVSNAQLDEDRSCVRFDFQNQTYFVRETAVEHSATKQSTAKACNREVAAAQSSIASPYGTTEAATMGMGGSHKCH